MIDKDTMYDRCAVSDDKTDLNSLQGGPTDSKISSNKVEEENYLAQTPSTLLVNIFDNRIDDCSRTEWIPFFDLHIDQMLFAELVSI